jgi:hypothetical protein
MTQEEVDYKKYQVDRANRAYRRTWGQANNFNVPSEILANGVDGAYGDYSTYGPYGSAYNIWGYSKGGMSSYPNLPPSNSSDWGGPWFGEVGRMIIWRSQTAPRDFMWTLHDKVETSDVVEKVEKRDVKKTKARKASQSCHILHLEVTR